MSSRKLPKAVRYNPLSEDRIKNILTDVQMISVIAYIAENRWRNHLFDTKITDPRLRNYNRMIYNGATGIKKALSETYKLNNGDYLEEIMATALDRVLYLCTTLKPEIINTIADSLERELKILDDAATSEPLHSNPEKKD